MKYLGDIDIDTIAEQVYRELDWLEVEDVWERSGSTRYGYVDPYELAWEMFEEALEPFSEALKEYQTLTMVSESKHYCMGVLKGIYLFAKDSKSEFKNWAEDAPYESFSRILKQWEKDCENPEHLKEMEEFINKTCPSWAK
ncbi:MAG: hypothetical protein LDL41_05170 [Coleofasciculus sp. S288]|nr:hypothetical protein [Coleofasciculus sp. S288]